MAGRRAVFLDRDGTLNRAPAIAGRPQCLKVAAELALIPGVDEALRLLHGEGLLLIVATNQPEIARQSLSRAAVDDIHAALRRLVPLDAIYLCPHDDPDNCVCRKPKPGLLFAAAQDWTIDLKSSVMVGDRWRDVEAGQAAGCRSIFIDCHYEEKRPARPDFTVASLQEAVPKILEYCGVSR